MSDQTPLFRLEPAAVGRNHECSAFRRSAGTTAALIYGLCISVALGIVLACTQQVAHKSTVPGRTTLISGDLKLYPDSRRRLSELQVAVGEEVFAGQPLANLEDLRSRDQRASTELQLKSLFAEQSRLHNALKANEHQRRQENIYQQANEALETRAANLQDKELAAARALLRLSEEQLARGRDLLSDEFISKSALADLDTRASEQRRNVATLQKVAVQTQRQALLRAQEFERRQYAQHENQRLQLAEIARLQREIQRIEHTRQQVLLAPMAGRITGILGPVGKTFTPEQPVISMVSAGADFRAELWAPSNAAGSLAPGQSVNLLLDAFPHQRHGMVRGTIAHINSSPLTLRELGAPWETNRIAYGVTVSMDNMNSTHPLYHRIKPGMQLTADIKLDNSTLFERLFDPLLSAVRRVSAIRQTL